MNKRPLHLTAGSLLLIAVIVACSLSPAGPSASQPAANPASGSCANPYYPVTSGNTWSYSSLGSALGRYTYSMTVANLGVNSFTTNEQSSLGAGTSSVIKWNCMNGNLAAVDAGADSLSLATSKMTFTSSSVSAEGYNIPNAFSPGTDWSERVLIKGVVVSGARTVNSQIASKLDCNVAGSDTVTVPAGTFNTVEVTCQQTVVVSMVLPKGTPVPAGAPVTVNITNWYAKGVGLVKSVRSMVGHTNTIVLTEYKLQ